MSASTAENRQHNNLDLKFDIRRVFNARSITNPVAFLIKAGISNATAVKLMRNQQSGIKWQQLQKICIALNCTPNDIFTSTGAITKLSAAHALSAIVRPPEENLQQMLLKLPANKLDKLRRLIEEENAG